MFPSSHGATWFVTSQQDQRNIADAS